MNKNLISLGLHIYTTYAIIWQRQQLHEYVANRTPLPPKGAYDFIVVGAGSAGAIVACRLSQRGKDVLLLEAGGAQSAIWTDEPALFADNGIVHYFDKYYHYVTVPQQQFGLSSNGILQEAKGKALGGSSTVNLMMYNRGNKKFYDSLVTDYGAYGWSYFDVLSYFKRTENNSDPNVSDVYHGRDGLLGVSTPTQPDPILKLYIQSALELGFQCNDINGPTQTGVSLFQSTVKSGVRSSTANAYLESGICPALTIITGAVVSKVLIRPESTGIPTAYGVEFIKNFLTYTVEANKEVILSAGPIASPQILMLSGVGRGDHLKSKGISPIYTNLPVGDNHCNHPGIINHILVKDPKLINHPQLTPDQLYQSAVLGTGPLAQAPFTSLYYSTSLNPEKDYPDILVFSSGGLTDLFLILIAAQNATNWLPYVADLALQPSIQMAVELVRPRKCGTIRLNTKNINDFPLIDPQFLIDPLDRQALVEALSDSFRLVEESSFGNYTYINPEPVPGCHYCSTGQVWKCTQYLECYIRQLAASMLHPAGGNRMGDPTRPDTVVDPRLRVKGIRHLRVVDSSIYSTGVNSNTNAPAMLVGEKGADLIYEDNP